MVVDVADPARRLLAFLALRRMAQPRALVAGSLWPEKPESRALANLRSALWAANARRRDALGRAAGGAWPCVATSASMSRLVQDDGWALIEHADDAAGGRCRLADSRLATAAAGLLFDDLLPGWYDDWVLLERERFAELQVHVLDVLVAGPGGSGQ